MQWSTKRVLVSLLIGQMIATGTVFAQAEPQATSTNQAEALGLPAIENPTAGELNCEAYTSQAPLEAIVNIGSESVIAGAELSFDVTLTNKTDRPLSNINTHLMIARQDGTSAGFVAEYLTIEQGSALAGKQSMQMSYTWMVPNNLPAGTYYPVVHVDDGKVPLLGKSFTLQSAQGQQRFEVSPSETSSVIFSTAASTLNRQSFDHFGRTVFIDELEENTVSVVLENTSEVAKTIPFQWNQYAGIFSDDTSRKNTKTELVKLEPGETKELTYNIENEPESSILVTASIVDGQTKSRLGFSLEKHGGNEVALLTSGLSNAPISGAEVTMFACLEASSVSSVSDSTTTLTLTDENGVVVESHTYTGAILGVPTGIGKTFTLEREFIELTLTTSVTVDGKETITHSQVYNCEALGLPCPASLQNFSLLDFLQKYMNVLILILLALIGLLSFLYYRRKRVPTIITLFFAIIFIGLTPNISQAKSVTWTNDLVTAYPNYTLDTSVSYYATVRNQTAGNALVTDGDSVSVGDQLSISVEPFTGSDVSWTPEGTSGPYLYPTFTKVNSGTYRNGYFRSDGALPGGSCSEANLALHSTANPICIGNGFWGSGGPGDGGGTCFGSGGITSHVMPVVVIPPATQVTISGTATLSCNASNTLCTVVAPGTISVNVSFAQTELRMYQKVSDTQYTSCSQSVYLGDTAEYLPTTVPQQNISFSFTASGGGGSCTTGTVTNVETSYENLYPVDCQSVDQGGNVNFPACSDFSYEQGDTVTNATDIANGECIIGPTRFAANQCSYKKVTISSSDGGSCTTPSNCGPIGYDALTFSEFNTFSRQCQDQGFTYLEQDVQHEQGEFGNANFGRGYCFVHYDRDPNNSDNGYMLRVYKNLSCPAAANTPPDPPTISGPRTGSPNSSYGYSFVATDPDGDQIYYQVDWNNDGVFETRLPSSGLVNSNTSQSANYSWATEGTKTFQARTVDSVGNTSAPSSYEVILTTPAATADLKINGSDGPVTVDRNTDVTLSWTSTGATSCTLYGADLPSGGGTVAVSGSTVVSAQNSDNYVLVCGGANDQATLTVVNTDPPTTSLEVQVNSGSWTTNDQTVNPSDSVRIRWSSYNATNCTGTGFSTGGATNSSGGVLVTTPAPSNSTQFSITCTGPGGSANDALSVTTRQLPNFTQPAVYTPTMGAFNATSATYDGMTVSFRVENNGGSATPNDADYRFALDLNNDGSFETNLVKTNELPVLAVGAGTNESEAVSGAIPIGVHRLRIVADSSGNPGKVSETDETDNVFNSTITVPPVDPGLSITADPVRVQNGQNSTISWTMATPYNMDCSVFGPGMATVNFNPTTDSPSGSRSAGPITAKSEYTLRCTVAGNVFTDTVIVETSGVIEEI